MSYVAWKFVAGGIPSRQLQHFQLHLQPSKTAMEASSSPACASAKSTITDVVVMSHLWQGPLCCLDGTIRFGITAVTVVLLVKRLQREKTAFDWIGWMMVAQDVEVEVEFDEDEDEDEEGSGHCPRSLLRKGAPALF
jgi:hypothetical protein